jgi:hypothetical protein
MAEAAATVLPVELGGVLLVGLALGIAACSI